tara:strand:- start:466 stop:1113 length:648 start_codon:yes stop_codon:yes gene_type:complete
MKKAVVFAGSRGIGKGIADNLREQGYCVDALSSKDVDTSDINSVNSFLDFSESYDVVVLNTGGPPAMEFKNISKEDCDKYHNQLFYSFLLLLQKMKINDNAYVFLISSYNVKEPDPKLILSNAYRLAFISVFKCLSKLFAERGISMINIAPGPVDTDRLRSLASDYDALAKRIPIGHISTPAELGRFVGSIVEKEIKYLTGVTINFDGGKSNYVL